MKKQMKITRNEGFTLVELMIVLSIIAILAVVLVPRVGNMRSSVREQGVTTNISSVRAFLELDFNNRINVDTDAEMDRLADSTDGVMVGEFTDGNEIINPFTDGDNIVEYSAVGDLSDVDNSVVVVDGTGTVSAGNYTGHASYNTGGDANENYRGMVVVYVTDDGYVLFGYNADGDAAVIQSNVIK